MCAHIPGSPSQQQRISIGVDSMCNHIPGFPSQQESCSTEAVPGPPAEAQFNWATLCSGLKKGASHHEQLLAGLRPSARVSTRKPHSCPTPPCSYSQGPVIKASGIKQVSNRSSYLLLYAIPTGRKHHLPEQDSDQILACALRE